MLNIHSIYINGKLIERFICSDNKFSIDYANYRAIRDMLPLFGFIPKCNHTFRGENSIEFKIDTQSVIYCGHQEDLVSDNRVNIPVELQESKLTFRINRMLFAKEYKDLDFHLNEVTKYFQK